jgi:rubrerythrin
VSAERADATRRDALGRGLAAAGALASAALVPPLLRAAPAFGQGEEASVNDVGIVEGAVSLEQTAALVYRTGIEMKLFGALTPAAELFARQEQQHADVLAKALTDLGGKPPKPPKADDVAGLTEVRSAEQMLAFAVRTENQLIAAYFDAATNLEDTALLSPILQIMPVEGQQLVVLRQAAGSPPVPSAFPSGEEKH